MQKSTSLAICLTQILHHTFAANKKKLRPKTSTKYYCVIHNFIKYLAYEEKNVYCAFLVNWYLGDNCLGNHCSNKRLSRIEGYLILQIRDIL